ncbi:MAG: VWA domain-containing protein [Pseudonocardia sp.]
MRLALLLTAVHPAIGGVLVRGEKGTAKSTVVRALAGLLPDFAVVTGCRFGCDPARADPHCPDGPHPSDPPSTGRASRLVELPVGATEDRLVGSLDLERALSEGVRAYQPGLLAAAHRGLLYVDEVNLLHDHLVDLLLDAAAMGRAHVERDGVSLSHASSFLLVGTMNPEEGELRPQLLDRFGLTVEVAAAREVDTRVEVVRRRLAYEADPVGFARSWRAEEDLLAQRVAAARARLADVSLPDPELRRIASVCAAFDVDGMRADLVTARTAVAHAAWRGAAEVAEQDVRVAARLALPHRRRRDPFDEPGLDQGALERALDQARDTPRDAGPDPAGDSDGGGDSAGGTGTPTGPDDRDAADSDGPGDPPGGPGDPSDGPDDPPDGPGDPPGGPGDPPDGPGGGAAATNGQRPAGGSPGGDGAARPAPTPAPAFRARLLTVPGVGDGAPGRRSRARTPHGRVVRAAAEAGNRAADLHLNATVLAAAPHQRARGRRGPGLRVLGEDLRHAVREGREGNLVLFVVDASGSMAARRRMAAVSGAVVSLLRDAYQRRDKVGLVGFRAGAAELLLPPTTSVPTAVTRLARLRTGGRTPLADGLLTARRVLEVERLRDPTRRPLLVLLTDGRATVPVRPGGDPVADSLRAAALLGATGVATVVVDCEGGPVRLQMAAGVAAAAGAALVTISELSADRVAGVVRAARAA